MTPRLICAVIINDSLCGNVSFLDNKEETVCVCVVTSCVQSHNVVKQHEDTRMRRVCVFKEERASQTWKDVGTHTMLSFS